MDDLTIEAVKAQLHTASYGRSLELKPSTGSTNDDARAAALAGAADGHTIVADSQQAGRGSRGRTWVSPAGTDLYFSLLARVPVALPQLPPLTLAVGLAVADALEAFLPKPKRALVKWPNDVWVDHKKCAGILVEGASMGEHAEPLVIGIGINVNRREFPSGLDTEPTSLALATGQSVDRSTLLAKVLEELERWVDRFVSSGAGPVVTAVEQRLALRGEPARCDEVVGTVEGIAPSGALRMRTDAGMREVVSGTLRPLG